jgi:RecQ family ATP-dependent DNA helicase
MVKRGIKLVPAHRFTRGEDDSEEEPVATTVGTSTNKRKNIESDDTSIQPARKQVASSHSVDSSTVATKVLNQSFGLDRFILDQEAVISRLLDGGNAVVVFPTGGGKSLCYQVPAVAFAEMDKLANIRGPGNSGITIVVSPLISLTKDQIDALTKRGVSAARLDSSQTREEYLQTQDGLRAGTLKLLYCAPERLNNEGFLESIKHVRGGVRMVAVDEAHCISEWGHSFRPDYLKVARFVNEIEAERVVCLTATATPKVAQDVCDAFGVEASGLFRTSMYRPNLRLLAEATHTADQKFPKLCKFLTENPGSTIIHATTQKQTEFLTADLCARGFDAEAFHAGMQTEKKTQLQDRFMANDTIVRSLGDSISRPHVN